MVTRLYLVRHGESTWNARRLWQGTADPPLSPTGIDQARRLALRLQSAGLAALYSSPLQRAAHTARIVAEVCGLTPQLAEGWREISFGQWEGLPVEEVERRFSPLSAWWARPDLIPVPGGEPLEQARARVAAAVEEVIRAHPHTAVAVVAHGGVNRLALLLALGAPLASYGRIQQDNGCVNVLDAAGESIRVVVVNDTDHLAPPDR